MGLLARGMSASAYEDRCDDMALMQAQAQRGYYTQQRMMAMRDIQGLGFYEGGYQNRARNLDSLNSPTKPKTIIAELQDEVDEWLKGEL